MIAAKLIIQTVLSVGALAGVVGGSYMMIGDSKITSISEGYFLVTSVVDAVTSNQPSAELWTTPTTISKSNVSVATSEGEITPTKNDKTQKNYKCISGEATKTNTNETCELYSIAFDTGKKSIDLTAIKKEIKENTTKKTEIKADLTTKKYFLLKTTSTNDWKFDGTDTVKLMSNSSDATEAAKFYATLTVHGKITANSSSIETDLIVVHAKDATSLTATATGNTYACKFTESEAASSCSIHNFTSGAITSGTDIKDLDWTTLIIPSTPASPITITQDKYYVIKWTKDKIKESKGKKVILVENPIVTGQTAAKSAIFDIKSSIIGNFVANKQEVIILK